MASPLFCEEKCPVCTNARKGNGFAKALQGLEMKLTRGGCPWGRARQATFGYAPYEVIPDDIKARIISEKHLKG